MKVEDDELEMLLYVDDDSVRGASGFRPVLERLHDSFLPRPDELAVPEKPAGAINSYVNEAVLKALDRKKHSVELINALEKLTVSLVQAPTRSYLGIQIPATLAMKVPADEIRTLFVDLIQILKRPTYGVCRLGAHARALHQAAYAQARRTFYTSGLYWLNFFGPDEIERQGGPALANNPIAKVEHLPQGLLIQVGDDPFYAATPEGENKLKQATAAMPSLRKEEPPSEPTLITVNGVRGHLDDDQNFWVAKHLAADAELDVKTISKLKRLVGKGSPPVKRVSVLFSRKETAEKNRATLAQEGIGVSYVDPETGQSREAQ
jgi:hypothetical protein